MTDGDVDCSGVDDDVLPMVEVVGDRDGAEGGRGEVEDDHNEGESGRGEVEIFFG